MLPTLFSLITFVQAVSALGWSRRIYYNGTDCGGFAARLYNVYVPTTPCPGGGNDPNTRWACENKSTFPGVISSEATFCNPVSPANVTDVPFFPTTGINAARAVNGSNYFFFNTFSGAGVTDCSLKDGKVNIDADGFLADGKCYATERDTYFKAACNQNEGVVYSCSDPQCNSCQSNTISTSCSSVNEGYRNAYCVSAEALFTSKDGAGSVNKTGNNSTENTNGTKTNESYSLNAIPSLNGYIIFITFLAFFF